MFLYIFLLFTLIPIAEVYLLMEVGGLLGFWDTAALVLLTGFLGIMAAQSQGREVIKTLEKSLRTGEFPSEAIIGGVMIFSGGILLLAPGFITDAFGFLLVIPITRNIFSAFIKKIIFKAIKVGRVEVYAYSDKEGWRDPNSKPTDTDKDRKPADIIDIDSFR